MNIKKYKINFTKKNIKFDEIYDLKDNKKSCSYCKNSLENGSKICSHCDQYTAKWKNELRYWSSAFGIIAAIFAALSYTMNILYPVWQKQFGKSSVDIISFRTSVGENASYSISNNGPSEIFVKDINVFYQNRGGNFTITVLEKIAPGGVFSKSNDLSIVYRNGGKAHIFLERAQINGLGSKILNQANLPSNLENTSMACFDAVFFDNGSSHIERMQDWGFKRSLVLLTGEAEGVVKFRNLSDGKDYTTSFYFSTRYLDQQVNYYIITVSNL